MPTPDTHNMFYLALVCPAPLDEQIARFKQRMKDHFSSVAAMKSPAHITLVAPFWLDLAREPELQEVLLAFKSDMGEVEVHLKGFSHFNKRVLFASVVENPALEELKKQAEQHFSLAFPGIVRKDDRTFHPHVTIANRDLKPGDFDKAWTYFSQLSFSATFRTRTISLLKLVEGKWKVIWEKSW